MRLAIILALTGTAALGQENAAGDALRKRLEASDLLRAPAGLRFTPVALNMVDDAAVTCAIPLANAPATGYSRMHLVRPPSVGDHNAIRHLPAPPCK